MSVRPESPAFTRSQALTQWLLTATRRLPRDQRFLLARRLAEQAFALDDSLVAASVEGERAQHHLVQADLALARLRRSIALCFEMRFFSEGQLLHVTGLTAEVGRLLGGWKKSLAGEAARPAG